MRGDFFSESKEIALEPMLFPSITASTLRLEERFLLNLKVHSGEVAMLVLYFSKRSILLFTLGILL